MAEKRMKDFTAPIDGAPGIVEITDIDGFLNALRDAIGPTLDRQQEEWEREKPAAMARAEGLGITITSIAGNCPVQGYGSFDGLRFYFRARGDEWQFHAWTAEKSPTYRDLPFGDEDCLIERGYGSGFDAGWMPRHEAVGFICEAVQEYRSRSA